MSTSPCPHCGNLVPAQARFCGQCGKTIERNEPPTAPPPPAAKTLMQTMNDPHAEERARAMLDEALDKAKGEEPTKKAPPPAVALGKTMLLGGEAPPLPPEPSPLSKSVMAPSSVPPPAPQAAPAFPSGSKTMLGMPARDLPQPPEPPAQAAPPPGELPPATKTMLGVAIPGIAPTHEAPAPAPANKPQGTLLGVAVPGIAPTGGSGTNVGFPAAHPEPGPPAAPPPPIVPRPAPLVDEPLPQAPRLPQKRGVPAVAVVLIVFVLVALAGGAAAFFILRSGAPLSAAPQLDDSGRESLKIACATCPDGTKVSLGASSAEIAGGAAVLPLPAPLSIGDNDLDVAIDRPGSGRDETVKVHVPVAYRVRADMATLASRPPAITVRIEAMPGSEVTVDGQPVPLDATGRGAYPIDLSAEVDGTSDASKTIDKKIAFTITPKGGKAEEGSLTARAAVVPLHLDAPGAVLYTEDDSATVSGQTKVGGTVDVGGQIAPVDAQGRFSVKVKLGEPGTDEELSIVASAPPLAPRIAHAHVFRVASLEDAAKELEGKGPLAYDAFAADPDAKAGQAVAIDGEVIETRAQQGYTVMLVDAKKGCAAGKGACLVRVVHGAEPKVARGDAVRAYGTLEGSVASGGRQVPDVDASLVLVRGGKK